MGDAMSRTDDVMLGVAEALDRKRAEIDAPETSAVAVSIRFDEAGRPIVSIVVAGGPGATDGDGE